AFCILASVIGEKRPGSCSQLFCYLDGIGDAYRTFGNAWRPTLPCAGTASGVAVPAGQKKGLCWTYNEGQCKWGTSCRFRHECSGCGGNPGASRCFKKGKLNAVGGTAGVAATSAATGGVPSEEDAAFLWRGFREGFVIPFTVKEPGAVCANLKSVRERPEVVREKLAKEVLLGRMAGPFPYPPLAELRISPLGVVPKKEAGKFRLIHHLSYPKGSSVNDDIDAALCSVSYTSFDRAVELVRRAGRGALMAKVDVEAAFRLLPIHPSCHHLLGCCFEGGFFVDLCLPMGCSISCAYFEKFSTFLEWVVRRESAGGTVVHYLDDFLCVGPRDDEPYLFPPF
ncbi:PREDICTED: uncharacterized protein LOC100494000, partial [Pelobates cultripes]